MGKLKVIVTIAGFFVIAYAVGRYWGLRPETQYNHVVEAGETAVLTAQGIPRVWLATDAKDAYRLQQAMSARDEAYLKGAEATGAAFAVAVETRARVTGQSSNRRKIEVLDGPMAGRTGWVEFEYLRPMQRGEM